MSYLVPDADELSRTKRVMYPNIVMRFEGTCWRRFNVIHAVTALKTFEQLFNKFRLEILGIYLSCLVPMKRNPIIRDN